MSVLTVASLISRVKHKLNEAAVTTDVGALHAGDGQSVVASVTVTAGGTGYTSVPAVAIAAPTGNAPVTTATAIAVLTAGVVTSILATYHGNGYATVPAVTITGGGGSGAAATAVVSPDVYTSDQGITIALNNAKNIRYRQVFAFNGRFTATWLASQSWAPLDGTGNASVFAPVTAGGADPLTETGMVLWWPRILYWPVTVGMATVLQPLTFIDEAALRLVDPAYQVTTVANSSAAPTHFYRRGTQGVGIYPLPLAASTVVTAEGFAIPPNMLSTGTLDYVDPSRAQLLITDAATEIIEKNFTDAQMGARLGEVKSEQADLALAYWLELPAMIRQKGGPFGTPPTGASGNGNGNGAPA